MIFSGRMIKLTGLFLGLFLTGLLLLNLLGYLFDLKYLSIFAAAQADKFEVRNKLLMQATDETGVFKPQRAAVVWANGLKSRNAALQYTVMTKSLKEKYAQALENTFPNWVTGVSSPWIEQYKIVRIENNDKDTYIFHLRFDTQTSAGPADSYHAAVTVKQEGDFWRIAEIDADEGLNVYTGFED